MKKRIIALVLALFLAVALTACGEYRGPDIKVTTSATTTTVNYHNGYRQGDVNIVENDDGGYTVTINVQPSDTRHAP